MLGLLLLHHVRVVKEVIGLVGLGRTEGGRGLVDALVDAAVLVELLRILLAEEGDDLGNLGGARGHAAQDDDVVPCEANLRLPLLEEAAGRAEQLHRLCAVMDGEAEVAAEVGVHACEDGLVAELRNDRLVLVRRRLGDLAHRLLVCGHLALRCRAGGLMEGAGREFNFY